MTCRIVCRLKVCAETQLFLYCATSLQSISVLMDKKQTVFFCLTLGESRIWRLLWVKSSYICIIPLTLWGRTEYRLSISRLHFCFSFGLLGSCTRDILCLLPPSLEWMGKDQREILLYFTCYSLTKQLRYCNCIVYRNCSWWWTTVFPQRTGKSY